MRYSIFIGIWILFLSFSCKKDVSVVSIANKIDGVNLVAPRDSFDSKEFSILTSIGAEWVSVIPFGVSRGDTTDIRYNNNYFWGETDAGIQTTIDYAKQHHLKIMMKPQVWFWEGKFTGTFNLGSTELWEQWEKSYSEFILHYLQISIDNKLEMFCVGTEFGKFASERPEYWRNLIQSIRSKYSGKIVYAANWDSYQKFPAWDLLDYVGIDAYFPLVDAKTPSVKELETAWKPYVKVLEQFSQSNNQPILFTEFGYRSMDYTAKSPWEMGQEGIINLEGQKNALEALFSTFTDKHWYAGGFLWKWWPTHSAAGGVDNNQFTPQNKPAEKIVVEYYGRNN